MRVEKYIFYCMQGGERVQQVNKNPINTKVVRAVMIQMSRFHSDTWNIYA